MSDALPSLMAQRSAADGRVLGLDHEHGVGTYASASSISPAAFAYRTLASLLCVDLSGLLQDDGKNGRSSVALEALRRRSDPSGMPAGTSRKLLLACQMGPERRRSASSATEDRPILPSS